MRLLFISLIDEAFLLSHRKTKYTGALCNQFQFAWFVQKIIPIPILKQYYNIRKIVKIASTLVKG